MSTELKAELKQIIGTEIEYGTGLEIDTKLEDMLGTRIDEMLENIKEDINNEYRLHFRTEIDRRDVLRPTICNRNNCRFRTTIDE